MTKGKSMRDLNYMQDAQLSNPRVSKKLDILFNVYNVYFNVTLAFSD